MSVAEAGPPPSELAGREDGVMTSLRAADSSVRGKLVENGCQSLGTT